MSVSGIKLIALTATFVIAGIIFIATGIYFGSAAFLNRLAESRSDAEEKQRTVHAGKTSGITALCIGTFTISCGVLTAAFPPVFPYLALIYICALIASFCVINVCFGKIR